MSDLIVPFLPSNLVLPVGMSARHVEGDVFNICERLKEIHRDLFLTVMDHEKWRYAVGEHCRDGVDRLVFYCRELDGRVLKEVERIMAMPLNERLRKLEQMEYEFDAQEIENELEELYERVGRPMWTELEKTGFVDGRGVSFPKRGVTGGRGSRKKS